MRPDIGNSVPVPGSRPNCGFVSSASDKYCAQCGRLLLAPSRESDTYSDTSSGVNSTDFIFVPDTQRAAATPKRWYRRLLIMAPLVLLIVAASVAGVLAYQTRSAFDEVQSLSTPPPEVSSYSLGLAGGPSLDTGPAQKALRQRELGKTQQADSSAPDTATDTLLSPTEPPDATGPLSTVPTAPRATLEIIGQSGPTSSWQSPSVTAPDSATSPATVEPTPEETIASADVASVPETAGLDGISILLMGADAREGESIDIGVRPDSLAVLHLDESTGSYRLLAVPRDSRATLPGYGQSKVNHGLAVGGIPYEIAVVEEYLGIELDNYALVDFTGIETVVDEFGGVTVENPEAFQMSGETFAAGTLDLNSEQALLYARFRGDDQGDFGRISRQQQTLRSLMDKAHDANLVRMAPSMFSLLSDNFRTDFGATDLLDLANGFRDSCTADRIESQTIPGDVSMEFDDMMQMDLSFVVSSPGDVAASVSCLLMADDSGSDDDPGVPPANGRLMDFDIPDRRFHVL